MENEIITPEEMKKLSEIKEKVDKVFYSVPQPTKLKEEYEKVWQGIVAERMPLGGKK